MGVVYLARDEQLSREIALKILIGPSDPEAVRRLRREGRAMAALGSKGVAEFYEAGVAQTGEVYLAMEFVRGQNVRSLLRRQAFSHAEALRVVREVATTLGRAHAEGLVHRDVKPDNVMICDDGRVVLLDFGIVKSVRASEDTANLSTQLTNEGTVIGTPAFLSPEQALGRPVGPASDQFSLAVMAYQLLAGELPWTSKEVTTIIGQILGETPPAASSFNAKLTPAVDAVLARALAKTPVGRFATIVEFADALEKADRGEYVDVTATQGSATSVTSEVPPRAAKRGKRGVVASAALAVSLLGGALYVGRGQLAPKPAPPAVTKPAEVDVGTLSKIPDAMAAYRRGLEALRDAQRESAVSELETAVKLDPAFAAAHLRRALTRFPMYDEERENLREAVRLRGALGAHDRSVLDALTPLADVPPDSVEAEKRLSQALEAAPKDSDLALQLCRVQQNVGAYEKAKETCARASALDPGAALPVMVSAIVAARLDDVPAALASFNACLKASPLATSCLMPLMQLQAFEGRCDEALASGRRLVADQPSAGGFHGTLASLLAGAGQPIEAVRTALDEKIAGAEAADALLTKLESGSTLAIFTGDFAGADQQLRAWSDAVARSQGEEDHLAVTQARVQLAEEEGDMAKAGALAAAYLAQRPAWTPMTDDDHTIFFDGELYRTGAISRDAFVARRTKWLAWKRQQPRGNARGASLGLAWIAAYAVPASTAKDAQEALDALPAYLPLPDALMRSADFQQPIGHVYLLAKRERDALPYLKSAANNCLPLTAPFEVMVANLELGLALDSLGEAAPACEAYAAVVRRWGAASSRSARRARGRMGALHCAP